MMSVLEKARNRLRIRDAIGGTLSVEAIPLPHC